MGILRGDGLRWAAPSGRPPPGPDTFLGSSMSEASEHPPVESVAKTVSSMEAAPPPPSAPPGRCGKCGYLVHTEAGFVCSECGSDLRQVGIIAGPKRGAARHGRVLRFMLFVVPWTVLSIGFMWALSWPVYRCVWPFEIDDGRGVQLTPLDGAYQSIKIYDHVRGSFYGANSFSTPIADLPRLTREVVATIDSTNGSVVLHVDLKRDMAWRRVGGVDAAAAGTRLDRAAVLDWLKAAGCNPSSPDARRQADQLIATFNYAGSTAAAGETCNEFDNKDEFAAALGFPINRGSFNGSTIGMSSGGGWEPVSMPVVWVPLSAAVWAAGLWVWYRRLRPRLAVPVQAAAGQATSSGIHAALVSSSVGKTGSAARVTPHQTTDGSRVLSIMFSDVKDYTSRSASQPRAGVLEMIRRHRSWVIPIVERHRGWVIKEMGDGILIAFDSATDAVLAGLEIQQRPALSKAQPLELRVAVSTGEVTLVDRDVFGPAVNLASRVQQLAEPGQVLLTETTAALLNNREVGTGELGTYELKGVADSVKVYLAKPVS